MKKSAVKESLTSRHTPTPLPHSIKQGLEIRKDWNYQANCQEYFVCYKKGPWLFKTADEKEANEFVQAVNAYEKDQEIKKELLDLVKFLHQWCNEGTMISPSMLAPNDQTLKETIEKVIAKAEGR